MKTIEMLKLYNFKALRKNKWLYLFTSLSIFITVIISLIVPQISRGNEICMENNTRKMNGGDLKINMQYSSKAFNDELDKIKQEGYTVKREIVNNGFYKGKDGKRTIANVIYGENSLKDDEIIIYNSLSETLNVKVGDEINLDAPKVGKKTFKVKAIENMPYGVTNDGEILGYGKVAYDVERLSSREDSSLTLIDGCDGDVLKKRLQAIEGGDEDVYSSLNDMKDRIKGKTSSQVATFSVITTMAYILAVLSIVSTTFMVLLKRKKEVAILRLVNNSYKKVKRSMMLEMGVIIGIPILLAGVASFWIAKEFLVMNGIEDLVTVREKCFIIGKGLLINGAIFLAFLNIAMMYLKTIKPLSLIRENHSDVKKSLKLIVKLTVIFIPVILVLYGLYIRKFSSIVSSLAIIIFIILSLIMTFVLLRLISRIPFKNSLWIYGSRSIRKNISSFILMILSITLTLTFILVGFTLDSTIKNSINDAIIKTLPYDHMIVDEGQQGLEDVIKNNSNIESYTKAYNFKVKLNDKDLKDKGLYVSSIKEKDYGVKYHITEGEDLFEGDKDGVLITSQFKKNNKVNIGDALDVELLSGKTDQYKIKGIYESGKVNSNTVIKGYDGEDQNAAFYIKGKNNKWISDINDSYIVSMDIIGQSFSAMVSKFLGVFKALSFISIFSCILFNINVSYMSFMREERDEAVIKALGIGNSFLLKDKLMKVLGVGSISILMGLGVFYLVMNLGMSVVFGGKAIIETKVTLIGVGLTIVLAFMAVYVPFIAFNRNRGYEILREE